MVSVLIYGVQQVASTCLSIPECRGFGFLPLGDGNTEAPNVTVAYLKGNMSEEEWQTRLATSFTAHQAIAFYTLPSSPTPGEEDGCRLVIDILALHKSDGLKSKLPIAYDPAKGVGGMSAPSASWNANRHVGRWVGVFYSCAPSRSGCG
jgi:hypothetical protein